MKELRERAPERRSDEYMVTFNYAVLSLVDELLWLPSAAVTVSAVHLLYGPVSPLPKDFLAWAGRGAPIALAALAVMNAPLGALVPSRLGPSGARRERGVSFREARALARDRYRDLQLALISGAAPRMASGLGSLVRDTYGLRDNWHWTDGARRVLARVVNLNRAALSLLAAVEQGQSRARLDTLGARPPRHRDLSDDDLDLLAKALPALVIPDFTALAAHLPAVGSSLGDEESIDRYQSLFAEMLSLTGHPEVRS